MLHLKLQQFFQLVGNQGPEFGKRLIGSVVFGLHNELLINPNCLLHFFVKVVHDIVDSCLFVIGMTFGGLLYFLQML